MGSSFPSLAVKWADREYMPVVYVGFLSQVTTKVPLGVTQSNSILDEIAIPRLSGFAL